MIWFLFALMTIATLALVLLPLFRSGDGQEDYSGSQVTHRHELEVYKDQLVEVESDLKLGMITEAEAEAARLEVSRRMLASAAALEKTAKKTAKAKTAKEKKAVVAEKAKAPKSKKSSDKEHKQSGSALVSNLMTRWEDLGNTVQGLVMASVVSVCAVAVGFYGYLGSPSRPNLPYAERFAKKQAKPLMKKMEALEAHLQKNKNDGEGWQKVAAFYMNTAKYHKAVFAFRRAIQIKGENVARLTGYAEATILANKGRVSEVAVVAYNKALKLDPNLVEPRVRLAMGLEQAGEGQKAVAAYEDILQRSSKSAPWIGFIENRIAILTGGKKSKTVQERKIAALLAKVEESLKKNPKAGRGWDVIAPVYLNQGQYIKAKDAFQKAIRLMGENAKRLSGLAEAITLSSNGQITPEANKLFQKALKLAPNMVEPRIRLAMGLEQNGNLKQAAAAYQAILDKSGKRTPWFPIIKERLETVKAQMSGKPRPKRPMTMAGGKGPTAEQVRDAQSMSSGDRQAFIGQMVARLAGRLEKNGNDLNGWMKLMQVYTVQGKKAEAVKALTKARQIFKNNKAALGQLTGAANRLGLK